MQMERRRGIVRITLDGYVKLGDSTGGASTRVFGSNLTVSSQLECRRYEADSADYISDTLGQQTQTLLRTTMESRLTDKVNHIWPVKEQVLIFRIYLASYMPTS
jgi:hypothetical protein